MCPRIAGAQIEPVFYVCAAVIGRLGVVLPPLQPFGADIASAPSGRADDFSWPRSTVNIETNLEPTPASAPAAAENPAAKKQAGAPADANATPNNPNAAAQRRARTGTSDQFPFRLPFSFPFFR